MKDLQVYPYFWQFLIFPIVCLHIHELFSSYIINYDKFYYVKIIVLR